jgi:hypothetical protein
MLTRPGTAYAAVLRAYAARREINSLGAVALVFCALAAPVSAGSILLTFSGTIDTSTVPSIASGTAYSGQLLYNTTETLLACGLTECDYDFSSSDYLTLTIGGYIFSISGSNGGLNLLEVDYREVEGGQDVDRFFAYNDFGVGLSSNLPGYTLTDIQMALVGPWGLISALSPAGLPTGFDFSDAVAPQYGGTTTGIVLDFSASGIVGGDISSIEASSVPEPDAGSLMALGLSVMALGTTLLRKRRSAQIYSAALREDSRPLSGRSISRRIIQ